MFGGGSENLLYPRREHVDFETTFPARRGKVETAVDV